MRKIIGKKGITTVCTALLLSCAAGFALQTTPVSAETGAPNELLLPASYEEYLPLNAPSGVAVCENYTAIADGNILYVYDRQSAQYRTYEHDEHGENDSRNIITQVRFDENETLYFTDDFTSDNLYAMSAKTLNSPTLVEKVACSAFALYQDSLYFTNAAGTLYYAPLHDTDSAKDILTNVSAIDMQGDDLFLVRAETYLHKLHAPTEKIPEGEIAKTLVDGLNGSVRSFRVQNNLLSYITVAGDFYSYPLSERVEEAVDETGYTAVAVFNDFVYTAKENRIRQFNPAKGAFTHYEICDNSPVPNRLQGAKEVLLKGDTLFLADNGNDRISVYDTGKNEFLASINAYLPPIFLASDGETLCTANETSLALYGANGEDYGKALFQTEAIKGKIVGLAEVYGKYYLATDEKYCYALTQTEGKWSLSAPCLRSVIPSLLASDAYGDLYIVSGKVVYKYAENAFLDASEAGEKIFSDFTVNAQKLLVDYERNLYSLSIAGVQVFERQESGFASARTLDTSEKSVFDGSEQAPLITSLSFGIERNEAYLLCEGNYIVKTEKFALPTVNAIAVQGADKQVFDSASSEFSVVKTNENALFVQFDIYALQGAEHFPYLGYDRRSESFSAIKIGEAGEYNLLAVFEKEKNEYKNYLVLKTACTAYSADEYRTQYETPKTGWLTNGVSLYKFPYFCDLLTVGENKLPRGGQVAILGEIHRLDHAYYLVEFTAENGETATGYIPQVYANLFDASPAQTQTENFGAPESDFDSLWRLAYILLGFAVIAILIDYLILRKKGEEK
ncbi:MAG: hypothetical protein IJB34_03140 [Clostridia bacterium]|nr:hypothetical protein [Clostridia bacterium]